jgi:hypothetical protein
MTLEETYQLVVSRTLSESEIQKHLSDPAFAAYFEEQQIASMAEAPLQNRVVDMTEVGRYSSKLTETD